MSDTFATAMHYDMQNPLFNPTGQKDTPSPVQTTDFGTVVSARSATAPRRLNAACVMCAKARPQGKLSYRALFQLHIFMCVCVGDESIHLKPSYDFSK